MRFPTAEISITNEVETEGELTYLGGRVSADGGCEATVTDRTSLWSAVSCCMAGYFP